jgi:hypothetical protein
MTEEIQTKVINENDDYKQILEKEIHHKHPLAMDEHGRVKWIKNQSVADLVEKMGGLNPIIALLYNMGYDKNSEVFRKLYRDLGVSLDLYWEVFYWEANNPEVENYSPQIKK